MEMNYISRSKSVGQSRLVGRSVWLGCHNFVKGIPSPTLIEAHRYFLVVVDFFVTYFDFIKDRDNHCVFVSSFCYRLSHLFCFINRLMHAMIISSICVKQKDQCLSER